MMIPRLRYALALVVCMAFVAAACGGEVAESDGDDGGPAAPTPEPDDSGEAPDAVTTPTAPDDSGEAPDAATPTTAPDEPESPPPNIYEDPRGGIFAEFQATMDRGDHPFMQIDEFCRAHDAAPDRVDTDKGITADSISITHIRSKLEDFAVFGFATDVGDPAEMFETFVAVVNEQCGGVRGRMIDLHTIHVNVLGEALDEERNAACIEAIEDNDAVIVVNSSGFQGSATLCIVEEHETAFINVQPQPDEFMQRSNDRLVTNTLTAEESLRWLVLDLIARHELDGKTIGVAAADTPGQFEAVETGLVNVLRDNGANVAVFDKIGCNGTIACSEGTVESVGRLRSEGVDVFFNVLNTISAPTYIQEMVNKGFEPGDVQFYASDFNSQAAELVASKIPLFGGEEAGALYDGAIILDSRETGSYRLEGYQPHAFNEMCADTYGTNSPSGTDHESEDRYDGNSRYGMVSSVCVIMRTALRALHDAGDNPTRAEVYATLANLGPIDANEMHPASLRPGKTRTPDMIHNLTFEFPCRTKPYPFPVEGLDDGICIYPINEYRPAPS